MTMTFQRARSDEQREVRRQTILATAAEMLTEMPVAALSLNELSRRVGLAKSNVLRYFESREAVLLELLAGEWDAVIADLDRLLGVPPKGNVQDRGAFLARAVAETLIRHPRMCELMSASAAVLERNISTAVARTYKAAAMDSTVRLSALTRRCLPEVSEEGGMRFALTAAVCVSGLWPLAHPSEELAAVYEEPAFSPMHLDFCADLSDMLETIAAGCVARWPAPPPAR
jgi:AcrR family transcriptional regulator